LQAGLTRVNYRDVKIAFPLGAVLVTTTLVALAPLAVLDERAGLDLLEPDLRRWIVYLLGIAFLGLLDDSLGLGHTPDTPRGWRGHASAVLRGELSTAVAIGALALAAYVTAPLECWYIAGIALLILTTNLLTSSTCGAGGEGDVRRRCRHLPDRLTFSPSRCWHSPSRS
jgi:threonine/homoserine/homoserine lactone efflux protein